VLVPLIPSAVCKCSWHVWVAVKGRAITVKAHRAVSRAAQEEGAKEPSPTDFRKHRDVLAVEEMERQYDWYSQTPLVSRAAPVSSWDPNSFLRKGH